MSVSTKQQEDQPINKPDTYYVPEYEVSVEASSVAEAVDKAKKQVKVSQKEDK